MGTIELPKKSSAGHSRKTGQNDIADTPDLSYFDRQLIVAGILLQETNRIVFHLNARLPKEAFPEGKTELDEKGGLKEKLYNCLEGTFQKMFSRYMETADGKSLLDDIEKDGTRAFSLHSPKEVAEILGSGGGAEKISVAGIEKSLVSGASAADDLEVHANSILRHIIRQKADVGVFLNGDNTCSVVKCAFRDNAVRPKTVTDVKLCVNIPDSLLIPSSFRYYAIVRYLINDLISLHMIDIVDKEIEALYAQEDPDAAELAVAYAMAHDAAIAEAFVERVIERGAKTDSARFDAVNIRESIKKNTDIENVCTQGFGRAVAALTSILDSSGMSYQFFESTQDGHRATIREYEDTDPASLPDEHYQITLKYLDSGQLAEDRRAYDAQLVGFESRVQHLWDLIEVIYQDSKHVFKVNDFDDLARKNKSRIEHLLKDKTDTRYENFSNDRDGETIHACLVRMRERITNLSECLSPVERRLMEERLSQLENEYARFDYMINPHLLQSGLLIDVDLTSIKRRKTTLNSVAIAIEEFLRNASTGFQDAATAVIGNDVAISPAKALLHR